MLTDWKKQEELDFLNEVSCVPLQQGLRHLQTAFTNFFAGRTKYPNFKKKHQINYNILICFYIYEKIRESF